jgi:hypothetical protein
MGGVGQGSARAARGKPTEGLAGEAGDSRGFGLRGLLLGAQFILGCGGFEFFEFQLHLIEQPGRAFRPGAVEGALEFLDLQLQVFDIGGGIGLRGARCG